MDEIRIKDYELAAALTGKSLFINSTNKFKDELTCYRGLGTQGNFRIIEFDGVTIAYGKLHLPFQLRIDIIDNPVAYVQMHFGITGSEVAPMGKQDLIIKTATHNMFFAPQGMNGSVTHARCNDYITFEVNFDIDYFKKIASQDLTVLKNIFEGINENKAAILSPVSLGVSSAMMQIIQQIINCELPNDLRQMYYESKVLELMLLQLGQYTNVLLPKDILKLAKTDIEQLHFIKDYLNENVNKPTSLQELSTLAVMNINKLKRGYKELFGTTIFAYLMQQKMNSAMNMLKENDHSIAEIALLTGYVNPQHFTAAFKKHFGILPKDIRK